MRRILIAVDGSKPSVNALDYVIERKKAAEPIEAVIVNVQPPISPRGRLVTRAMIKEYQAHESEKVLTKPQIKVRMQVLHAKTYVEIGDAATRIVDLARKVKCHEIAIGSRGLGAIRSVMLGSVVHKVLQICPLPVVVVK